jgi:nucleotide-binding universal stress UspA family protein
MRSIDKDGRATPMKIVVAIDFSRDTGKVLEQAEKLAMIEGACLDLIYVAKSDPTMQGYQKGKGSIRESLREQHHEEHEKLEQFADKVRADGVEVEITYTHGDFADVILEHSEKVNAEMIVLGSHGKGLATQLLLGSVSEVIIRYSEIPVLVVPTHKRKK